MIEWKDLNPSKPVEPKKEKKAPAKKKTTK